MNKKAAVEIDEIVKLLLYIGVAIIVIAIIILLAKYLFNEINLGDLFRLG